MTNIRNRIISSQFQARIKRAGSQPKKLIAADAREMLKRLNTQPSVELKLNLWNQGDESFTQLRNLVGYKGGNYMTTDETKLKILISRLELIADWDDTAEPLTSFSESVSTLKVLSNKGHVAISQKANGTDVAFFGGYRRDDGLLDIAQSRVADPVLRRRNPLFKSLTKLNQLLRSFVTGSSSAVGSEAFRQQVAKCYVLIDELKRLTQAQPQQRNELPWSQLYQEAEEALRMMQPPSISPDAINKLTEAHAKLEQARQTKFNSGGYQILPDPVFNRERLTRRPIAEIDLPFSGATKVIHAREEAPIREFQYIGLHKGGFEKQRESFTWQVHRMERQFHIWSRNNNCVGSSSYVMEGGGIQAFVNGISTHIGNISTPRHRLSFIAEAKYNIESLNKKAQQLAARVSFDPYATPDSPIRVSSLAHRFSEASRCADRRMRRLLNLMQRYAQLPQDESVQLLDMARHVTNKNKLLSDMIEAAHEYVTNTPPEAQHQEDLEVVKAILGEAVAFGQSKVGAPD